MWPEGIQPNMVKRYSSTDLISVEDALATTLRLIQPLPCEQTDLLHCQNRVLAANVASDTDLAPFANSAMDGFAVRFEDIASAKENSKDSGASAISR